MKYNYPIKYACMPIYEQNGWIHGVNELEENYEIAGYITSKCYVISEKTTYNQDGTKKSEYEVVFPYQIPLSYTTDKLNRTFPKYNFYNKCNNSTLVNNIYDNFSEAKVKTNLLNDKLILDATSYIPFDENYLKNIEETKNTINERLAKYREFELKIEQHTQEMVNKPIKPQNIIVMFEKEDKILEISLYEFMKLYDYTSYLVCSVSVSDFENQIKQIKINKKLDERDPEKSKCSYNNSNCLLAKRKNNNIIRIANYNDKNIEGSYYLSNDKIHYDNQMIRFDKDDSFCQSFEYEIKAYTTENFEDIINSYKQDNISLDKVKQLIKK